MAFEKCNDTLGLGFKGDTTLAYYVICGREKGHKGKHREKERITKGADIIEYRISWKKVDGGK